MRDTGTLFPSTSQLPRHTNYSSVKNSSHRIPNASRRIKDLLNLYDSLCHMARKFPFLEKRAKNREMAVKRGVLKMRKLERKKGTALEVRGETAPSSPYYL